MCQRDINKLFLCLCPIDHLYIKGVKEWHIELQLAPPMELILI